MFYGINNTTHTHTHRYVYIYLYLYLYTHPILLFVGSSSERLWFWGCRERCPRDHFQAIYYGTRGRQGCSQDAIPSPNSWALRNSAHLGFWHECLLKRLPPDAQHGRSAHQFAAHRASGLCLDPLRGTGLAGIFAQHHLQVLRTPGDPWGGDGGDGSYVPGVPFRRFVFDGSGGQPKHVSKDEATFAGHFGVHQATRVWPIALAPWRGASMGFRVQVGREESFSGEVWGFVHQWHINGIPAGSIPERASAIQGWSSEDRLVTVLGGCTSMTQNSQIRRQISVLKSRSLGHAYLTSKLSLVKHLCLWHLFLRYIPQPVSHHSNQ